MERSMQRSMPAFLGTATLLALQACAANPPPPAAPASVAVAPPATGPAPPDCLNHPNYDTMPGQNGRRARVPQWVATSDGKACRWSWKVQ
jgi:hypothetical protein